MKRVKVIMLICLISTVLLHACSGKTNVPDSSDGKAQRDEIPEFAIATKIQTEDYQNLKYSGGVMEIPYMLQDQSETNAQWGIEIILNGILQEFSIKESNGDMAKLKTMHVFDMKKQETKYITLIFTPNTGRAGDKLNLNICTILSPNYLPNNIKQTEFRPYHNLNGGLGACLTMQKSAPYQTQISSSGIRQAKTTEEQKKPYLNDAADDKNGNSSTINELEQRLVLQLYHQTPDEQITEASNGKSLEMTLSCFGKPGRYRICIFVNHVAVPVFDGKNYLDITVSKDFTVQTKVKLDIDGYEKYNSIYAIASPIRTEPAPEQWHLTKTPSKFLIVT